MGHVSRPQQVMNLAHQRGPVLDGDGPLVCITADNVPAQPDLDAALWQRRAAQGSFGVPLNVDECLLELLAPLIGATEEGTFVPGKNAERKGFLPAGAGDANGEGAFLPRLLSPVTAVH